MAGRRHVPIVMSQPEVCHTGRAGHDSDSADVCIRFFFLKISGLSCNKYASY